jgi:hypothetical protein
MTVKLFILVGASIYVSQLASCMDWMQVELLRTPQQTRLEAHHAHPSSRLLQML